MNRREALAALGASVGFLAGCQQPVPSTGASGETPTTPPPRTAESCTVPGRRRIEIGETASVPDEHDLSVTARVDEPDVTQESPARLTVRVTNTGPERMTGLADAEYCHLFNRLNSVSSPGLRLFRQQDAPPTSTETCWRRDKSPDETQTFIDIPCSGHPFAAGASIQTTYEVWQYYRDDGYMRPDTYQFSATFELWSPDDDADRREVEYWLDLEVTEP